MQIFSARGTNPSGREAGMRMGLLSKEMIALPPQSDNHEKLTVPGPSKRNRRGDMRCNHHTTHTPTHADRLGMRRQVTYRKRLVSLGRGMNMGLSTAAVPDLGGAGKTSSHVLSYCFQRDGKTGIKSVHFKQAATFCIPRVTRKIETPVQCHAMEYNSRAITTTLLEILRFC